MLCPAECLCQESWEGHILLDSAWKPVLFSCFFRVRFTNSSHRFPISPLSKRQGSWQTDLNPSVSVKWDPPGSKHTLKWLTQNTLGMFKSRYHLTVPKCPFTCTSFQRYCGIFVINTLIVCKDCFWNIYTLKFSCQTTFYITFYIYLYIHVPVAQW